MTILITSASRKVSLVRAFRRALEEEGGGKVIAVDMSPYSPALYFADEARIVPPSDDPTFIEQILRLCRERGVRAIVPTRDEELPLFSSVRGRFEKNGIRVAVPGPDAVRICRDKRAFTDFCAENGFETPAVIDPANIDSGAFPLFVRPRRGAGGRAATRVDTREQLEATLRADPDSLVQEWIDGPEFTVDVFSDFSGRVISAVPRERIRIVGGESFVCRTSRDTLIMDRAAGLAASLKLTGHSTVQCFRDGGQVKFIEINPRFGGASVLSFEAGAPSPLFLVRLLRGKVLEPRLGKFRDNYVMLRYTRDIFLDGTELKQGGVA